VPALDLDALAALVERPDEAARAAARERQAQLVGVPAGSLGRLDELAAWLAGVQGSSPPRPLTRPRVVVFAGDHGVAEVGVSAYPPEATAAFVRAVLAGDAVVNTLADAARATVRVVDMAVDADLRDVPVDVGARKVGRRSGRIDVDDALTYEQAQQAFRAGMAVADAEVDAGADLLIPGDVGVGNTTAAAVLIAALTGADAASVTGRGSGIDDTGWMRKCAAVRDALRRARPTLGDPIQLLATAGGADFAAMTGFLLQAAVRRTPVILDGVVSTACALAAHRVAFRARDWWVAGHRSPEPGHAAALERLGLQPILDLGMRVGGGCGALVALPVLAAAAAALPPPRADHAVVK